MFVAKYLLLCGIRGCLVSVNSCVAVYHGQYWSAGFLKISLKKKNGWGFFFCNIYPLGEYQNELFALVNMT